MYIEFFKIDIIHENIKNKYDKSSNKNKYHKKTFN